MFARISHLGPKSRICLNCAMQLVCLTRGGGGGGGGGGGSSSFGVSIGHHRGGGVNLGTKNQVLGAL